VKCVKSLSPVLRGHDESKHWLRLPKWPVGLCSYEARTAGARTEQALKECCLLPATTFNANKSRLEVGTLMMHLGVVEMETWRDHTMHHGVKELRSGRARVGRSKSKALPYSYHTMLPPDRVIVSYLKIGILACRQVII